jgi:hypothetical protein
MSAAMSPHTAHPSPAVMICYRYHPFYNCSGRILRRSRYRGGEQFVIQLDDGTTLAVPAWMLDPTFCARLVVEPRPRLELGALRQLRRLVEVHSGSRVAQAGSTGDPSSPSGERHGPIPSHDGGPAATAPAIPDDDRSS